MRISYGSGGSLLLGGGGGGGGGVSYCLPGDLWLFS